MRGAPNPRATFQMTPHEPAANTAAIVTLAARAGERRVISQIDYSLSGTIASAPALTITGLHGGTYSIVVPAAVAVNQLRFSQPLVGLVNTAVVVTLAAAGASAIGKINVVHDV